jgi:hypothetical protein
MPLVKSISSLQSAVLKSAFLPSVTTIGWSVEMPLPTNLRLSSISAATSNSCPLHHIVQLGYYPAVFRLKPVVDGVFGG